MRIQAAKTMAALGPMALRTSPNRITVRLPERCRRWQFSALAPIGKAEDGPPLTSAEAAAAGRLGRYREPRRFRGRGIRRPRDAGRPPAVAYRRLRVCEGTSGLRRQLPRCSSFRDRNPAWRFGRNHPSAVTAAATGMIRMTIDPVMVIVVADELLKAPKNLRRFVVFHGLETWRRFCLSRSARWRRRFEAAENLSVSLSGSQCLPHPGMSRVPRSPGRAASTTGGRISPLGAVASHWPHFARDRSR